MTERQQFDRLAIRGFRGLSDIDISGLGEVNILLGANDVGKTSMLEAVLLISAPADPRLPIRVQNSRGYAVQKVDDLAAVFLDFDIGRDVVIEAFFGDYHGRRKLKISTPDVEYPLVVDGKSVGKLESRERRELQYNVEIQSSIQEAPESFQTTLIDRGDRWEVSGKPADDVVIDDIQPRFFVPSLGYDPKRFGDLIVNKKDQLLVHYLQHINSRVTKISVSGDVAYLDIGLAQMMPLNMFGGGVTRIAMILAECILQDSRILLVDELEQGLHHQAISFLLESILMLSKERGVQIFATTHSIEVIEGLQRVLGKKGFSEHQATTKCITLQRDKDGLVRAYRYDYQQFDHCIEHGIEIR